jgi:hypothetical protein
MLQAEMKIWQHSSTRALTSYVTRRRGQGPLNRGRTVVHRAFKSLNEVRGMCHKTELKTPWLWSASEIYRPSDRRLLAK